MATQLAEKAWYIITTYSMHEAKTADNLKKRIQTLGLEDLVLRVVVADVEEPVLKDGLPTGKTKKRNLFPGYIFVEMIMTDDSWFKVRNCPGVTGIVGSSGGGQAKSCSKGRNRACLEENEHYRRIHVCSL